MTIEEKNLLISVDFKKCKPLVEGKRIVTRLERTEVFEGWYSARSEINFGEDGVEVKWNGKDGVDAFFQTFLRGEEVALLAGKLIEVTFDIRDRGKDRTITYFDVLPKTIPDISNHKRQTFAISETIKIAFVFYTNSVNIPALQINFITSSRTKIKIVSAKLTVKEFDPDSVTFSCLGNRTSEKREINIFGSCCSRELFNYAPLKNIFRVKRYALQVSQYMTHEVGLDVSKEAIDKIDQPAFIRRMIDYELNKKTLSEFEKSPSEFFLMDTMSLASPLYEVEFCDRKILMQGWLTGRYLPTLKNIKEFEGFKYKPIPFVEVDINIIKKGLDNLCEWVKKNYAQEKVIIYEALFFQKFIDLNGFVRKTPSFIFNSDYAKRNKKMKALGKYMHSKLPNAHYIKQPSSTLSFDKNSFGEIHPPLNHYTPYSYFKQGETFIKKLGINYSNYDEISSLERLVSDINLSSIREK